MKHLRRGLFGAGAVALAATFAQHKTMTLGTTSVGGTYKNQHADEKTVGLYNFGIAHKNVADDVAYLVTKTVLDNNVAMVQGHIAAKGTIAANAARNGFLPFHPGAVQYDKEKGVQLDPATLPR